jgi:hypothetical protein
MSGTRKLACEQCDDEAIFSRNFLHPLISAGFTAMPGLQIHVKQQRGIVGAQGT